MREAGLARRGHLGGRMLPRALLSAVGARHQHPRDNFWHWPHGCGRRALRRPPAVETQQSTAEDVEGGKDRTGTSEVPNSPASPRILRNPARRPTARDPPTLCTFISCLKDVRTAGAWLVLSRGSISTAFAGWATSSRSTECPSGEPSRGGTIPACDWIHGPPGRGPQNSDGQHERAPRHDPLQHDDQGP